jgi:hypothetical protein
MKFRQEWEGESVARGWEGGGRGRSREFRRKKYFACKALVRNLYVAIKRKIQAGFCFCTGCFGYAV